MGSGIALESGIFFVLFSMLPPLIAYLIGESVIPISALASIGINKKEPT
jgi:hypothetical protein